MILDPTGEPVKSKPLALKPCPFCGETKQIYPKSGAHFENILWYECLNCGCTGGTEAGPETTRERVAERWNRRPGDGLLRKKTLEEMLQFVEMHTPPESPANAPVRLCFKVLRTELLKLTDCKDMDEYLSKE